MYHPSLYLVSSSSLPLKMTIEILYWWYTYPSEKYWSVGVTIPNIWKNKLNVPNQPV
jgi:hypothetical protein